ncbi:hypothetical protein LTR92_003491 [Exophiala xenobiotica]|nr:hypothetical protein LTR92_003491 [Exophiala xenobiotica]KAK5560351.1 hypothetical protein LTR46_002101 [Exophiala xenobiotica]
MPVIPEEEEMVIPEEAEMIIPGEEEMIISGLEKMAFPEEEESETKWMKEMMCDMDRVEELQAELEALQKNTDGYMGHAERRQEKANKFWWKLPLSNKNQLAKMKTAFYKTKETLADLKVQADWAWVEMIALENPGVAEEKAQEWRQFRTKLEALCEKQDGIRAQVKEVAKLQKSDMIAGLWNVLGEFELQTAEFENLKEQGLAFELASTITDGLLKKRRDITACWKVTDIDINEVPMIKERIEALLLLEEHTPMAPEAAPWGPMW